MQQFSFKKTTCVYYLYISRYKNWFCFLVLEIANGEYGNYTEYLVKSFDTSMITSNVPERKIT